MKSIIMFTLVLSTLIGCRPEQAQTDFNVLIDVPIGENVVLQTNEDTSLDFNYNVKQDVESVDLQMAIAKHPKNGTLIGCTGVDTLEIQCTYVPRENFSGIDYIEVNTWDGDIVADERSIITIEVLEVSDAPVAFDATFSTKANDALLVDIPKGVDSDSLQDELNYQFISAPQFGVLTNCVANQCQYVASAYTSESETLNYQITDESGKVSNTATITINISSSVLMASESFTQGVNTYEGVDIVWVIDNSGSMSGEQQALRQNFTAFIDNFLDAGKAKFPFNMAVTTTDAYELADGSNPFRTDSNGNTYDLSSTKAETDFASFKQDFEDAVLVGTSGSGDERAYESIDRAYNLNPNWFGGNNRLLTYIILSDETEHSAGTVQSWADKFFALKDKAEKVSVFPIIRLTNDNGARWAQIATLTGTTVSDIDQPFQTVLDNISLSVSQNISSYQLNPAYNIVASSLTVTVDNVPVVFTYANNVVQLATPPAPYATIVVNYEYVPGS